MLARLPRRWAYDSLVLGSDFPHAEGLAEPESFVQTMTTLTSADIRKVMRDNGRALLPLST